MGESTEAFIGVMKELYRVCCHGAVIHIAVPHPRHDSFLDDPTHVRAITPELMGGFSKRLNRQSLKTKSANTTLALYHDVDFEIEGISYALDEPYATEVRVGRLTAEEVQKLMRKFNNVAAEWRMNLRVIKGGK